MIRRTLVALAALAALAGPAIGQARPPSQKTGPITVFGEGSTGPINDMTAMPNASKPLGTMGRNMFELLQGTVFYVRPYLVGPDGKTDLTCQYDQAANIARAQAAAPATAVLVFPSGCIKIASTQTITKQIWRGAGVNTNGTEIQWPNPTGTAIKLMGDGAIFSGFHLYATVPATDSIGIQQGIASEDPTRQGLEDVFVNDFTTNIYVESGYFWNWQRVWTRNFKKYGALIRNMNYSDRGDWSISGFVGQYDYANPPADSAIIRAESGGSGKITGSKFLGAAYALDWSQLDSQVTTPPGGGTGDLQFSNNSVENQSVAGVRVQAGSTYSYGSTSISGNELAGMNSAIIIGQNAFNTSISGNVLYNTNYGVQVLPGARTVYIGGNMFDTFGQAAVSLSDDDVANNIKAATDVTIGPNGYSASIGHNRILDQRVAGAGSNYNVETRPITRTPSQAAAGVYAILTRQLRSASIRVVLEGQVQGYGAVWSITEAVATNTGSSIVVTPVSSQKSGLLGGVDAVPPVTIVTNGNQSAVVLVAGAPDNFVGSVTVYADGKFISLQVLQ